MTAALKLPQTPLPVPSIPLGTHGERLWNDTTLAFADWLPHDLATLAIACAAWDDVATITEALAGCDDHKLRRQFRADRNAAATTYRQQMRELSLSAVPQDSRPPRIAGRYA